MTQQKTELFADDLVLLAWSILQLSETTHVNSLLLMLMLSLAIADTWTDGLIESVVLGLAHLGLLRLASP